MGRLTGFTRDGLTFDVRDGGPEQGDTVLLLHGFPADGSCWSAVSAQLHSRGLRTLAPDQRGHSAGARPDDPAAYRVTELVNDAIAVMDAAGVPAVHLLGHGGGGTIAWALAEHRPERVHTLTVLSTPHPEASVRAMRSGAAVLRGWYLAAFPVSRVPDRVLTRLLTGALTRIDLPAADLEAALLRLREPGALPPALAAYRALDRAARRPAGPVRVPTTFVWGRADPVAGRVAAELTRDHVSAPYRFVELDAGHWLPQTHPVQVTSVVLDRIRTVTQA